MNNLITKKLEKLDEISLKNKNNQSWLKKK